eukprot:m.48085 g.48085  ORF g.48085 m.48085 type:complete len:558 (-) comp11968_c0_seq1:256-1929(-)
MSWLSRGKSKGKALGGGLNNAAAGGDDAHTKSPKSTRSTGASPVRASATGEMAGATAAIALDPETRAIALRMRAEVPVKDRMYHLQTYKRCFVGREAARWLVDVGYARDIQQAEAIGNRILKAGVMAHCVDPDHMFESAYLFYRWINDAQPVAPDNPDQDDDTVAAGSEWVMPDLVADVGQLEERVKRLEALVETTNSELQLLRAFVTAAVAGMSLVVLCLTCGLAVGIAGGVIGLTALVWAKFSAKPAKSTVTPNATTDANEDALHGLGGDEVASRVKMALADVARVYPEYKHLLTTQYIKAVLQAPSRKDPTKPRSFAYGRDKLLAALKFRREHHLDRITPSSLGNTLACGSMYWNGYDPEGRPVLWVRPLLKDWKNISVAEELRLHAMMIDHGISMMPEQVHSMVLVADATGMGLSQASPALMKALLKLLTEGFPGRLGRLYVGPVNLVVRSLFSVLKPLLPPNLKSKIVLMAEPKQTLCEALGGLDKVPHHFGGEAVHFESADGFSYEEMETTMRRQYHAQFGTAPSAADCVTTANRHAGRRASVLPADTATE